jgi:hypothetical protein
MRKETSYCVKTEEEKDYEVEESVEKSWRCSGCEGDWAYWTTWVGLWEGFGGEFKDVIVDC